MRTAPIYYVLAQVRFNPILRMASSVEALQERWRREYPDFQNDPVNSLIVSMPDPNGTPEVKNDISPRWDFTDRNATNGFLLANDSLTFHTTNYTNSVEFIQTLLDGLALLHQCVSLSYVDGLGFRTLDAIKPDAGHDLSFYLRASLMGLYGAFDGQFIQAMSQLMQDRIFGRLVTRTVLLNSKLGIPSDLAPLKLRPAERFSEINGPHAILDNDISQDERFDFDLSEIDKRLRIVKDGLNDAFYNSITKEALESWK